MSFLFLTGFVPLPAVLGPAITVATSGNLVRATAQLAIDNEFKKRIMLPLSLSYDHRIIDGAEAARFCNDLKENLGKNFAYRLAI